MKKKVQESREDLEGRIKALEDAARAPFYPTLEARLKSLEDTICYYVVPLIEAESKNLASANSIPLVGWVVQQYRMESSRERKEYLRELFRSLAARYPGACRLTDLPADEPEEAVTEAIFKR